HGDQCHQHRFMPPPAASQHGYPEPDGDAEPQQRTEHEKYGEHSIAHGGAPSLTGPCTGHSGRKVPHRVAQATRPFLPASNSKPAGGLHPLERMRGVPMTKTGNAAGENGRRHGDASSTEPLVGGSEFKSMKEVAAVLRRMTCGRSP